MSVQFLFCMQMKRGDGTMFITKLCFLKASLQYGKNLWVFFPTYLSVQLTALEAKLKTLIGLQSTLKFVLYTAVWRTPCWKQKWMSK